MRSGPTRILQNLGQPPARRSHPNSRLNPKPRRKPAIGERPARKPPLLTATRYSLLATPLTTTLHHLAALYRRSAAGIRNAARDYTLDYEAFLRTANLHDGDERETAEQELLLAEQSSNGLFRIDRHPRSGQPQVLRLAREGGEAWLFSRINEPSPASIRESVSAFFRNAALQAPEPWVGPWNNHFTGLATRALAGESILPFKLDDPSANEQLLSTLRGVIAWQGESLIRYASSVICGDSKRLQSLESRLLPILTEITGRASFEDFGILPKPRSVTFHGPLLLARGEARLDFSAFPAPHTLSAANLPGASLQTGALLCLTVENEDVFLELAKRNPGVLLVLTSFPGSATLQFLSLLPAALPFHHFGDTDPAGFDILRDLRAKTGREVRPFLMDYRPSESSPLLSPEELLILERLMGTDELQDLHHNLDAIRRENRKGDFEQESIPIVEVIAALRTLMSESTR